MQDFVHQPSGKSHVSASVNQNNMRKHNCQTHTDMQLCTIAAVESRGLSFCNRVRVGCRPVSSLN